MLPPVSPPTPRPYRSEVRARRAEHTRASVQRAAAALFAAQGYTGTSVRQIAAAAGVSVQTVVGLGGKAELFLLSFEMAFSGTTDGASLLDLDEVSPMWQATTLGEQVEALTGFIAASNARSADLWTAYVEAANTDPLLARAYAWRMDDMRRDGHRVLAETLRRGWCPAPTDPEPTVDAIWVVLHPSQQVLLVRHAGWSPARYRAWMVDNLLTILTSGAQGGWRSLGPPASRSADAG